MADPIGLPAARLEIRTAAAEQFYLINNTYGQNGTQTGLCTSAVGGSSMWIDPQSNMATLITDITTKVGGASFTDCGTSASAWAVAVRLPSAIAVGLACYGTVRFGSRRGPRFIG